MNDGIQVVVFDVERAVAELGSDCIIGTVLNRVNERQIPAADYYYYSRHGKRDSNDPVVDE